MKDLDALEFSVWDRPPPAPPRMTPELYDRFLHETLFRGERAALCGYEPVPAEFQLVKEDVSSEGQNDER